jgi:hypothetical protein
MSPLCAPRVRHRRVAGPEDPILSRCRRLAAAHAPPWGSLQAGGGVAGAHGAAGRAPPAAFAPATRRQCRRRSRVAMRFGSRLANREQAQKRRARSVGGMPRRPWRGRRAAAAGRAAQRLDLEAGRHAQPLKGPCRGSARGVGHSEPAPASTTFLTACRRSATVNRPRLAAGSGRGWATVPVPCGRSQEDAPETLFVLTRCLESRGALIVLSDMLTQPILDGATTAALLAAALSCLAGVRAYHRSPTAAGKAEHGRQGP